jgi:hypothetical protein
MFVKRIKIVLVYINFSLRGRPSVLWGAWFATGMILAARGRIEGLQERQPFMTTRRSDSGRWIRSPDWSIPRQWKTVVFVDFNIGAYQLSNLDTYQLSNLNSFLILNCWTSWLFFLVQQRYGIKDYLTGQLSGNSTGYCKQLTCMDVNTDSDDVLYKS